MRKKSKEQLLKEYLESTAVNQKAEITINWLIKNGFEDPEGIYWKWRRNYVTSFVNIPMFVEDPELSEMQERKQKMRKKTPNGAKDELITFYLEGHTIRQAAQYVGINYNTAMSIIHKWKTKNKK